MLNATLCSLQRSTLYLYFMVFAFMFVIYAGGVYSCTRPRLFVTVQDVIISQP